MQFRPEDTAASGPSPKVKTKKVEDFTYGSELSDSEVEIAVKGSLFLDISNS